MHACSSTPTMACTLSRRALQFAFLPAPPPALLPTAGPCFLYPLDRPRSEQLEYLEDKLREYRFLEPAELDNKVAVGDC